MNREPVSPYAPSTIGRFVTSTRDGIGAVSRRVVPQGFPSQPLPATSVYNLIGSFSLGPGGSASATWADLPDPWFVRSTMGVTGPCTPEAWQSLVLASVAFTFSGYDDSSTFSMTAHYWQGTYQTFDVEHASVSGSLPDGSSTVTLSPLLVLALPSTHMPSGFSASVVGCSMTGTVTLAESITARVWDMGFPT